MTAATETLTLTCECAHPKRLHHDGFDDCGGPDCPCTEFRRAGSRVAVQGGLVAHVDTLAARATADDEDEDDSTPSVPLSVLVTAKRSHSKRTVSLALKIEQLLDDLAVRIREESGMERVRREVADLEAKLAAAKAKLRGNAPQLADTSDAQLTPCPECGKPCKKVGIHRAKAHGYRRASSEVA